MGSWIQDYLKFTERHEAPELFHLWTALAVLSAAAGRKIWFDRGYYKLYPNLYVILNAGSARCRKSTAIKIGLNLLEEACQVNIIGDKSSPERMLLDAEYVGPSDMSPPAIVIAADELSVFLPRDTQGDRMLSILTKLYDCPDRFEYRTIAHKVKSLRHVYPVIIAGTTPELLGKCLPDIAFGGGLASRLIIVYQKDTERRNPLPALSDQDEQLRGRLIAWLKKISVMNKEFKLSPSGEERYRDWYAKMPACEDKRMDGYYGRKHDHVLRVAMLLALSQDDDGEFEGNDSHIDAALMALDTVEQNMRPAYAHVGTSTSKEHVDRIKSCLMRHKRLAHSDLLRKMYHYMNATEFREAIESLIVMGMVERQVSATTGSRSIYQWLGDS